MQNHKEHPLEHLQEVYSLVHNMTLVPSHRVVSVRVMLEQTQFQFKHCVASIQPSRLSKNLTSAMEFDQLKIAFPMMLITLMAPVSYCDIGFPHKRLNGVEFTHLFHQSLKYTRTDSTRHSYQHLQYIHGVTAMQEGDNWSPHLLSLLDNLGTTKSGSEPMSEVGLEALSG